MSVDPAVTHRRTRAERALEGRLLRRGDARFDDARQAWNLALDQRPAAIVTAECSDDVVAAVGWARERGLQVAAQSTGHGAGALGSLDDTLLLRTSGLRKVAIDPGAGVARLGAGVIWQEAVDAAATRGLALLAGSAADVGVVGYTLGGGLSWLGRAHGLAANSVVAIELVTADGRIVRADAEHEADLFWALRGGGGSFGVVTSIELRLLSLSETYAGGLWWPLQRAPEVLEAWRQLTAAPMHDELTTVARCLRLPPLPVVPEPLRGRAFVVIEAFELGDPERADAVLAPLRALGPELDTLELIGIRELARVHMDPPQPIPAVGDGMLLRALPAEAIEALLAVAGDGVQTPLLSVELRQLGGELARSRPEHGALAAIRSPYTLYAVGIAPTAEAVAAIESELERIEAAMAPWAANEALLNFADTRRDPATLWSEHVHRRLRHVKERFDPQDLIRANHPV
ncbi:MAG: FAD-binding oxidoreductase [Solirubrobacteraceae bacterium]